MPVREIASHLEIPGLDYVRVVLPAALNGAATSLIHVECGAYTSPAVPISFAAATPPALDASPSSQTIFRAGTAGYFAFRIPVLVATNTGVLIAFAEGRKNSLQDNGNIDIVLRRSEDWGGTAGRISRTSSTSELTPSRILAP